MAGAHSFTVLYSKTLSTTPCLVAGSGMAVVRDWVLRDWVFSFFALPQTPSAPFSDFIVTPVPGSETGAWLSTTT